MKIAEYVFEVTVFQPERRHTRRTFKRLSEAVAAVRELPENNAVVFVAALGNGVDYGNFYLFLNGKGKAHVMLHEHREFFAADPSFKGDAQKVEFRDEDGTLFAVEAELTTSATRGKIALEQWLPNQAQWQEFIWH